MDVGAMKRAFCAGAILGALPSMRGFAQELPACSSQRLDI